MLNACRDASPRAARDALLGWAEVAWPESPPRDLVALAARVRGEPFSKESFAEAVLVLDRALWSDEDAAWIGEPLAARLPRAIEPPPERRRTVAGGGLPSLHPM